MALSAAAQRTVEFNRDVRPILSDRCFTCHGPDPANRKTALRFDTEAGARIQLKNGSYAIRNGDPANSGLYKRLVSSNQAVRMPPAYMGHEKLSDREIETIRLWIEQGAKWQGHWSLIPPVKPALPSVSNPKWPHNAIDRFVLARLDREGLSPSPEAAKRTLIRRVTLDLTGLPPAPAEVEAFVNDPAPDAYEKVVARLLSSTQHAERMAIRWLEAARYADTNGYQSDGVRSMWRWRDWVIDAFHRNMPFDRFTVEQIAGDLLPDAKTSQKVATGFHRNHRTSAEGGIVDEEFRVEYVADRAETTSTVWLGLTMGCSRCHDHKYDPLTQRDFYSLFAFFNNVPEKGFVYNFGNEPPFIAAPNEEQEAKLTALDSKAANARERWEGMRAVRDKAQRKWERSEAKSREPRDWNPPDALVVEKKLEQTAFEGKRVENLGTDLAKFDHRDPLTLFVRVKAESGKGAILTRAEDYWEGGGYGIYLVDGKVRFHKIFRWTDLGMRIETRDALPLNDWHDIAVTYDGSMKAAGAHIYVDGKEWPLKVLFDQHLWPMGAKLPLRIGAGAGLGFQGSVESIRIHSRALTPDEIAALSAHETPAAIARIDRGKRTAGQQRKLDLCFLDRHLPAELASARKEILEAKSERDKYYASLPTVMVMAERKERRDTFVLKRGAYDAPGEKVEPAVPASIGGWKPEYPANRLGLARWIVSRENPLTARVTVNRFWQMLTGMGLVKTIEDFGSQGEWPIHQDLLDWLAVEFMDSGWNVRHLLHTIVTSATYRQSSRVTPELLQRDPENRLFARSPRHRLSPEMIRDQALAVSGLLVKKTGGPSVKPYQPAGLWQELTGGGGYKPDTGDGLYRRSLYTYWRRTIAPPAMITFDSPTRETCIVRESRTNTPLQALNLMNDVTFVEAARKLGERILKEGGSTAESRIGFAYSTVLGRPPGETELRVLGETAGYYLRRFDTDRAAAESFLKQGDSPRDPALDIASLAAWSSIASVILNLDETVTKE